LKIPVYPGTFSGRPIDHALVGLEPKKRSSISRSKSGLGLIFLGLILEPIPKFPYLGLLAIVTGAILVFLGRRNFNARHQRYVTWAFILTIGGLASEYAGSFILGVLFALSLAAGGDPANSLSSLFVTLYVLLIIIGAVIGLGLLLFTYDLQNATGRIVLWVAYSLSVGISIIVAAVVYVQVQELSAEVVSQAGQATDAAALLDYQFASWRLLQLIPAIFYTIAYYRIRSELEKRVALEPGMTPQ